MGRQKRARDPGVPPREGKWDSFAERLEIALRGESVLGLAKRSGVGESLFRKYLAGAEPGIDKAVKIADATGVSVEWLVSGRGAMRPESEKPAAGASFDVQLLVDCIVVVEELLAELGKSPTPEAKARKIVEIYKAELAAIAGGNRLSGAKILSLVRAA